jgi:hypothetical protein
MGSPSRRYARVWTESLQAAVKAGLSHRPLRYVLATMLQQGSLTGSYAQGFVAEMNALVGREVKGEFYLGLA